MCRISGFCRPNGHSDHCRDPCPAPISGSCDRGVRAGRQRRYRLFPPERYLGRSLSRRFDAWVGVSHLRFGPSEQDDRAFALAFWPDPRGSTPKALAALIRDEDPVVSNPDDFSTVSIAARGFYALEFLLFDPQFATAENTDYLCALIQASSRRNPPSRPRSSGRPNGRSCASSSRSGTSRRVRGPRSS